MRSSSENEEKDAKEALAFVCDTVFGGAKLWHEIVTEAEKDVVRDKENKRNGVTPPSDKGIDTIIKLINDSIFDKDEKINEADEKKIKENLGEFYQQLKADVADVRIFRVGNTPSEKVVAVVKSAGRFVGGIVANTVGIVGSSLKLAGGIVHATPAAYLINRLPLISKKEQIEYRNQDNNFIGTAIKRTNFIEILGDAIGQGAKEIALRSNALLISKTVARLNDNKLTPLSKETMSKMTDNEISEKIGKALPNIRKNVGKGSKAR